MSFIELFILAIGLSMDAFAVSICKGLAIKKLTIKECGLAGIWFGGFQALMPTIGYFLGTRFTKYIVSVDHWIAFILLALIGINMIKESYEEKGECADCGNASMDVKEMFVLAVATSIDALAIGITLAFLNVNIIAAASFIGITTFVCSAFGVKVGNIFGIKYKSKAELAGGIILVLIGLKILLEHLGFLA
ncbi:MAG: manganese efflux pump [Lachnospiraceae bacterium]|nr:manganese efflux pump [Lachnospiraceae bacterium]